MSSKLKVNNIIPSTGTQIGISTTGGGINLLTGTVVTGVVTATSFSGPLTGAATNVTVADESSDTSCNVLFTTAATGNLPPKSGSNLTFNSANGTLTATTFSGGLPITNGADNRVITASSASAIQGESDLTFDGTTVKILNTVPKIELNDGSGRILQIRGGSTSHNPSIITQYASSVYIGGKGVEGVGIGSTQLTITNGDLIIGNSPHSITALGANSSTYGELKVEVAASDFSGSNNVATFKRGSNGAINLAFPSGGGIDFSATPNGPSGVNELLDDYEEGSYTPEISAGYSSISYHNPRIGYYTRVGNHVSFQIYLYVYQATGAAAEINISLPFTAANNTGRETGAYTCYTNGFFSNSSGDKAHCTYLIGKNDAYLRPCKSTNGAVIYGNDTYLGTGANNRYLVIAGQMFV